MKTNHVAGIEAAYAANEEFDDALEYDSDLRQIEQAELPDWIAEKLSNDKQQLKHNVKRSCELFRYFNDQAVFFLSQNPETHINPQKLAGYLQVLRSTREINPVGCGSPRLDQLAEKIS